MTDPHTPKDGDFAAQLEAAARRTAASTAQELPQEVQNAQDAQDGPETDSERMEEPDEPGEEAAITDDELERQALAAPGADGDPSTPE